MKSTALNIESFNYNKNRLEQKVGEIHIDSVMIEKDNKIEYHFYNTNGLHELHSCSKILVALAVGVAIDRKVLVDGVPLTLETKVYPLIKNVAKVTNSNVHKIERWTIKNLLTHTTGYDRQMMSERFIRGLDENALLDYALNYDIPHEVGTRYAYNNVEPFIISVFFQEALHINLADFINENIFKKLDISTYQWPNYGKYCPGATGLLLKPIDFHKIGQLLLYNGKYKETQVVPSAWIDEMCTKKVKTPSDYKPERLLPKLGLGYFTFISKDGFIFRDGRDGQYIIVNKKRGLLITLLSSEPEMQNVTEILRGLV